jgi:hypothetical protein
MRIAAQSFFSKKFRAPPAAAKKKEKSIGRGVPRPTQG